MRTLLYTYMIKCDECGCTISFTTDDDEKLPDGWRAYMDNSYRSEGEKVTVRHACDTCELVRKCTPVARRQAMRAMGA